MDWEKMKRCPTCKEVKPKGEFHKEASRKDGLAYRCKECARANSIRWYVENAERQRANSRRHAAENPEKARAAVRKWHAENPERSRTICRKWRAENPEKTRAICRKAREELKPYYVKYLLKKSGLPPIVIEENPELIELKRLQIQLNRKINQKKKEL